MDVVIAVAVIYVILFSYFSLSLLLVRVTWKLFAPVPSRFVILSDLEYFFSKFHGITFKTDTKSILQYSFLISTSLCLFSVLFTLYHAL